MVSTTGVPRSPPWWRTTRAGRPAYGAMVQMVGRLPSKEEVAGSIPAGSTSHVLRKLGCGTPREPPRDGFEPRQRGIKPVQTDVDYVWTRRPHSPLVQLAEQGTVNAHVARSSRARGA